MGHRRRLIRGAFVVAALAITAPLALAAIRAGHTPLQPPTLSTDLGSRPLFDLSHMRPGVLTSRCVTIVAGKRRIPEVALLASQKSYPLDPYIEVVVVRGQGAGGSCAAFRPDRDGLLFAGTLRRYPRAERQAIIDKRPVPAGGRRVYRFTVALYDNSRAQGLHSVASFSFAAAQQ